MPNLKMLFGKTKGHIAEMLAKEHLHFVYRPRELPITLLDQFKIKVPDNIKNFLRSHWLSIDLFGFVLINYEVKNLILYEVKGRNHFTNPAQIWHPRLTSNCRTIYSEAQRRNYVVKYVEVLFLDNWNYDGNISDFNIDAFRIDDGNPRYRGKGALELMQSQVVVTGQPVEVARQQN